jgi:hypothetical protein
MPTIHYLGDVVPSNHIKLTATGMPQPHYHSTEFGIDADINVSIIDSIVDVTCTMSRYEPSHFPHLHKIAFDMARATVHLYTFASGNTLAVIFNWFIDVDGTKRPLLIQHQQLAQFCKAFSLTPGPGEWGIGEAANVVFSDHMVFTALDHLVGAVSHHSETVVNCARAIETLRTAVALPGASRKDAWEQFRTALNIDKKFLKLVTDTSTNGRHGQETFIPGEVTGEIIRRAWIVMNRFLEFRKKGSQPLSSLDFPLLEE